MREPVLIDQDATFVDALRKMILDKTNSLLVVNKSSKLIGEIQPFELIKQVVPAYVLSDEIAARFATDEIFKEACEAARNVPIEKFMNKNPKTITLQGSLLEGIILALSHGQSRIPVVDEQHRPLGVLTRTQLKQIIGKYLDIENSLTKNELVETKPFKAVAVEPLTSFLLPVDGSKSSKQAVKFGGCLASALADRVTTFTLLHVWTEGYLKRRLDDMAKVRVKDEIIESHISKASKQEHISQDIMPMLKEMETELKKIGTKTSIDHKIVDGMPAKQILQIAQEREYSTIIIGRRGISAAREILLGSVTSSLLHKAAYTSVYVIGAKSEILKADVCPLPRILVALDGSANSFAAASEASIMAKCYGNAIDEVILLHVITPAGHAKSDDTVKSPEEIINQAQKIFIDSGVSESKISSVIEHGKPGDVILNTAEKKQTNLVIMGRRGLSTYQEFFMGSVSRQVIQNCDDATVGIICGG
jgi:nucleotide-binding universal stress UspA family protein